MHADERLTVLGVVAALNGDAHAGLERNLEVVEPARDDLRLLNLFGVSAYFTARLHTVGCPLVIHGH